MIGSTNDDFFHQTRSSIFDLEKNWNMFWNQGSQLLLLPNETEFFHEIFIFSTSLLYIDVVKNSIIVFDKDTG